MKWHINTIYGLGGVGEKGTGFCLLEELGIGQHKGIMYSARPTNIDVHECVVA